jgi:beta-glucanase (GH16 family)
MKIFQLLLVGLSVLITMAVGLQAAEWELVWSDEFDYKGLPDPTKWDYEEGFIRNGESQYYTRGRLENARVENGMLVIECRKEHYKPEKPTKTVGRDINYTAASLITRKKVEWQYGRIEVQAKIPQGKGVWPAIWMLGTNISKVGWPSCGEIDIMEFVGKEPNHIYATMHYAVDGKHKAHGNCFTTQDPYNAFHVYSVEWTPEQLDVFFDNKKYESFAVDKANNGPNKDNAFRKPFYLLINFALGGGWGGKIDDSILPQKYLIDYVRVYRHRNP